MTHLDEFSETFIFDTHVLDRIQQSQPGRKPLLNLLNRSISRVLLLLASQVLRQIDPDMTYTLNSRKEDSYDGYFSRIALGWRKERG